MVQEYINSTLQQIIASAKNPAQLAGVNDIFSQLISGKISSFRFPSLMDDYLKRNYAGEDFGVVVEQLTALMLNADKRLRQSQTRFDITDLITPQEHALLQSGEGAKGIKGAFHACPYTPMILIEKPSTDIAAVNAQRTKRGVYRGHGSYFGLGNILVKITLEPLNENGETVRDPRPLDERLQPVATYTTSLNFPFQRT